MAKATAMANLPNSLPEKLESFAKDQYIEHWMYVHELRALLDELQPDDWLTPNRINNLVIGRGEKNGIGIIDFSSNEIEFWEDGHEKDDSDEPRKP
jgi:hypothetical protein